MEQDLVGGIDNNGSIGTGLDSGKLTVPFFIHLLLDQFRGEGLGDQTVGIGLSLGFDQFGFGVDLSGFFFLVGFRDSNFFFFFGIDVGGLLLDLCQLQILLSVDLFLDSSTGFVIGVDIDQRNGFNDDTVRLELILEVGGEFRVEGSTLVAKQINDGILGRDLFGPGHDVGLDKNLFDVFTGLTLETGEGIRDMIGIKTVGKS